MRNYFLNDKIKENHQGGTDDREYIKSLYGKDYKKINKLRWKLFKSLDNTPFEVQRLRLFVQNTILINKQDIEKFDKLYSKAKEEYDLKKSIIKAIEDIREFAIKYHLK